ncbi:MAG: DUF4255 domain-containing protein [Planctomycetaceae bacterium]|nr:DUF4255 domain-containing protein [Planctomycetaceae bacterium]MCB9950074.1 DUF4255 domain-containing protein [Planctomycetaceae bacterium]
MIDFALDLLKTSLNGHLRTMARVSPDSTEFEQERVSFPKQSKGDSLEFPLNTISMVLVNVEQERTMRRGDPFARVSRNTETSKNGESHQIQPDIPLSLFVLFVARFEEYRTSLEQLSRTIQYFQSTPVFGSPSFDEGIGQLVMELHTLSLAEQHEIWSLLRQPYHPSALYRVRMVVFQDASASPSPQTNMMDLKFNHKESEVVPENVIVERMP